MNFGQGYRQLEPVAKPNTRFRIIGPLRINGMDIWRIFTISRHGKAGEQVGPDHFTYQTAVDELRALVRGKRSFYFNGVPFEKHSI